jgi:hypothetical protein
LAAFEGLRLSNEDVDAADDGWVSPSALFREASAAAPPTSQCSVLMLITFYSPRERRHRPFGHDVGASADPEFCTRRFVEP